MKIRELFFSMGLCLCYNIAYSQLKLFEDERINPFVESFFQKKCQPYIQNDIKLNIEQNITLSEAFYNYKKLLKQYDLLRFEIIPYCYLSNVDSVYEPGKILQNIFVDTTNLPREIIFYKGRIPAFEYFFFNKKSESYLITSYRGTFKSLLGIPKFKVQRRWRRIDFKGYFPGLIHRPFIIKKGKLYIYSKKNGGRLLRGEKFVFESHKKQAIVPIKKLPGGMELL